MEQIYLLKTDYGFPENPAHVVIFSLKFRGFQENAAKEKIMLEESSRSVECFGKISVKCPGLGSAKGCEEETHARRGHIKYTPNISRSMIVQWSQYKYRMEAKFVKIWCNMQMLHMMLRFRCLSYCCKACHFVFSVGSCLPEAQREAVAKAYAAQVRFRWSNVIPVPKRVMKSEPAK